MGSVKQHDIGLQEKDNQEIEAPAAFHETFLLTVARLILPMTVSRKDDYGKVSDVLRNVYPITLIRLFIRFDIHRASRIGSIESAQC